jgi:hypothetical protein
MRVPVQEEAAQPPSGEPEPEPEAADVPEVSGLVILEAAGDAEACSADGTCW